MRQQQDLIVTSLGACHIPSPLSFKSPTPGQRSHFVHDSERIRFNVESRDQRTEIDQLSFEEAGPKEKPRYYR